MTLFSQTVEVKGTVTDKNDTPLSDAIIYVHPSNQSIVTNQMGEFTLSLNQNSQYKLTFSYINHYSKNITVKTNTTDIQLGKITLDTKSLGVVVVESKTPGITIDKITPPALGSVPSSTGNFEDYIKVSALGVSSSNELTSNYNVRGGNYDENLIYVNGIQIYRPFLARSGQQEGLSFINSAFVDNIYFSAGGFDAFYGDKLSSVLDITYREPTDFGGSFQLSLMGAEAHVEGVFGKGGRGNYLTGARYRNNGYLLNSLPTTGDYSPTFFDYQILTNYYTSFTSPQSYQKVFFLGHYSNNNYRFIPSTQTSTWGTVNEAYQLKVYYDGQEDTRFETFTAASGYEWKVSKQLDLKLVSSVYHSIETENFDILGEYWINELETDASEDNYGDSTANVGVGGMLDHGRNELEVWIANIYHSGEFTFKDKQNIDKNRMTYSKLFWGAKLQYEQFDDQLSEWHLIDSAGYAIPQGSTETIDLIDVIKTNNYIESYRTTAYAQYAINMIRRKTKVVDLKQTVVINDTLKRKITARDTFENSPAKVAINFGLRSGYRTINQESWLTPRLNISYSPRFYILNEDSTINRRNVKFKLASGLYYQPPLYREFRGIDGELNLDVVSQKSFHNVIGADIYFKMWGRPFKFTSEAYYKYMWDVNPYEIDNVRIRYYADNNAVAYAYGLDAKINGEFIKGVESFFKIGFLQTKEDILDDPIITLI